MAPAEEITEGFWWECKRPCHRYRYRHLRERGEEGGKGNHTSCGIALVPLFAPSLSAAAVVLSVILPEGFEGACVDVKPSCSERGPVDFGIELMCVGLEVVVCSGFTSTIYIRGCLDGYVLTASQWMMRWSVVMS
jgi:hypothetical protein